MPGTLIIGAGQAGQNVATRMRRLGYSQSITLVGAETNPPYQRPPLSKGFLLSNVEAEELWLLPPATYHASDITLLIGDAVTKISAPNEVAGGIAITESGHSIEFSQLCLCVGGRPARLTVPGADLGNILYLRDVDDAVTLRQALRAPRQIVVIGGGFIGLEAAASARKLGHAVTVVEAADRLLGRAVAPAVSEAFRQAHERRGISIVLAAAATGFTGEKGRVQSVSLSDGSQFETDLVLVAVGLVPELGLAEQLGLACERGILVDEYTRTSNPLICAAGDCTQSPNPLTGAGPTVCLESVQNAIDQAQAAAATLSGQPTSYRGVPWFWSDQDTMKLQIAGLSHGYDDYIVLGDTSAEQYCVLYLRDEQLISVNAVNRPKEYLALRRALSRPEGVGRTSLAGVSEWLEAQLALRASAL